MDRMLSVLDEFLRDLNRTRRDFHGTYQQGSQFFGNLSTHIIRMLDEEYKGVFTFEFEFLHLNLGSTDVHIREFTFLHSTKCAMM